MRNTILNVGSTEEPVNAGALKIARGAGQLGRACGKRRQGLQGLLSPCASAKPFI